MCSRCAALRGGGGRRPGFEGLKTVSLIVQEAKGRALDIYRFAAFGTRRREFGASVELPGWSLQDRLQKG